MTETSDEEDDGITYRDFANVTEEDIPVSSEARKDIFPVKLHYMLSELEKDGLDHIVSWQPHGRSFIVHDQVAFEGRILRMWFTQSKFSSFQRQLNIYGFHRINDGDDKGGYYHQLFLRGKLFLAKSIRRKRGKSKETKNAAKSIRVDVDLSILPHLPETITRTGKRRNRETITEGNSNNSDDSIIKLENAQASSSQTIENAPQPLLVQSTTEQGPFEAERRRDSQIVRALPTGYISASSDSFTNRSLTMPRANEMAIPTGCLSASPDSLVTALAIQGASDMGLNGYQVAWIHPGQRLSRIDERSAVHSFLGVMDVTTDGYATLPHAFQPHTYRAQEDCLARIHPSWQPQTTTIIHPAIYAQQQQQQQQEPGQVYYVYWP